MALIESHSPKTGLRQRKKEKTRAAIQQQALRLFRDQGYGNTTVEQIAEAADISTSTFFRYFPTKEDVVLNDEYDARFIEALHAQPAELTPIQAIRRAMKATMDDVSHAELALEFERGKLLLEVPDVRGAYLNTIAQTMRRVSEEMAIRVDRDPTDIAILSFTGAVFGVCMSLAFRWMEDPKADFYGLIDEALAHLEAGLPL